MARPRIEWDEKQWRAFEGLCSIMCTQEEICGVLEVTDKTLTRLIKEHYDLEFSEAYARFTANGKASLRRKQFALAEKNAIMAIFLGKVYLKQREAFDDSETEDTTELFNEIERNE